MQYVPMLHDPSVIVEPEYVDPGVVPTSGSMLLTVKDDKITLGKDTLDLDVLARIFSFHSFKIFDEASFPVATPELC